MKKRFGVVVIATLVLSFCLAIAQTPAASNGDPVKGKKLFMEDGCYFCHGQDGHRAGQTGKLAPKPIAVAAATAYIRKPAGQMIAYSDKVVSDADMVDIWAYLRTIPENPSPDSIAILKSW